MLSNTISKTKFKIMGILLILFSFFEFGLAAYVFTNKEVKIDKNKEAKEIVNECLEKTKKITKNDGFITRIKKEKKKLTNTIEIKKYSLNDPIKDVYISSLILNECPKMKLDYFCYGEECKTRNGLFMEISIPK